ncbi:MAG: hypothetical protein U0271_27885 [Polyangiaceae bacterium]
MFNAKPYYEVNREERNYCALFAHALLSSSDCRERACVVIRRRTGVALDPHHLEVYLEVAALRDYWNDLGDPQRYDEETHRRRRAVLDAILSFSSTDTGVIDREPLFWTNGVGSKLWSPARWDLHALDSASLPHLKEVRMAFNAKPDILLMSPTSAVVLEAKVESGEGRNEAVGYAQIKTQKLIVDLWKKLIPIFQPLHVVLATLKLRRASELDLEWADVLEMVDSSGVDAFTKTALGRLARAPGA